MWCSCRGNGPRRPSRCWTMPEKDEKKNRDMAVNRRAYHDYFIDEKLEAGRILTGSGVKAGRGGRAKFRDGFVRIDGNEARVENGDSSSSNPAQPINHPAVRPRQQLTHRP